MQIPKPALGAMKLLEELTPHDERVSAKKVFGNPAAFVNGNMFLGVFGENLFVRLSENDISEAARTPGFTAFEPMPGRPMRGYMVLPPAMLRNRTQARQWIQRSLTYASGLPPKKAKKKSA